MNYFELQEFMKKINPGKNISFDFDDSTIRQIECIYTDGQLHTQSHVEHQRCKVTVEGKEPIYAPIMPHRMLISAKELQTKLPLHPVYIHPDQIKILQDLKASNDPLYAQALQELSDISGLTADQIESKC